MEIQIYGFMHFCAFALMLNGNRTKSVLHVFNIVISYFAGRQLTERDFTEGAFK